MSTYNLSDFVIVGYGTAPLIDGKGPYESVTPLLQHKHNQELLIPSRITGETFVGEATEIDNLSQSFSFLAEPLTPKVDHAILIDEQGKMHYLPYTNAKEMMLGICDRNIKVGEEALKSGDIVGAVKAATIAYQANPENLTSYAIIAIGDVTALNTKLVNLARTDANAAGFSNEKFNAEFKRLYGLLPMFIENAPDIKGNSWQEFVKSAGKKLACGEPLKRL